MSKPVKITVDYPTMEHRVMRTVAQLKEAGYKNATKDQVQHLPVNRPQHIQVKQLSRKVQEEFMTGADYEAELVEMCKKQTGMTPSAYQARYKRAWNE